MKDVGCLNVLIAMVHGNVLERSGGCGERGRSETGIGARGASIWCICLSRSGQVDSLLPTELIFRHLAAPL
jgi:hypothetical protein